MPWVELFAAFVVCHLAGDYLFQTDWQAQNKRGGLGGDASKRRALVTHVIVYTLCFVPALAFLWDDLGAATLLVGAGIFVPHLLQDDGRVISYWCLRVKGPGALTPAVMGPVDQAFHFVTLIALALAAGS